MKKCIVIPDSFKGTMTSLEVSSIMKDAIQAHYEDVTVLTIPIADGGEGTVDSFLLGVGGKKITCKVTGPYHQEIESFYGIIDNDTAVIEMASCAGLSLVGDDTRTHQSTTYGVGELILEAASHGVKKIIVGLGGSATTDGGVGAACAIGVSFYDKNGDVFIPTGETLTQISRIDTSTKNPLLDGIEIITMCDIDNPLYGKNGAAYIFSPQKGANDELVMMLDNALKYLSDVVKKDLYVDISHLPGGGAAGGMGGGMVAFFESSLTMGIEVLLDIINFDELLKDTDIVFTGEGKIDTQSLHGKVVIGIAKRTKKQAVPLVAVVGDIGDGIEQLYEEGVHAIFSINRVAKDFSVIKSRAKSDLALTMDNLVRFVQTLGF